MSAPPSPAVNKALKRKTSSRRPRAGSQVQLSFRDAHKDALQSIRIFLKSKSCYDVLPLSFRVIVLDTKLEVKKALQCLITNGVVSACLWNSDLYRFAGMLTVSDFVHLMAYYYKTSTYDDVPKKVEGVRLEHLRDIERELNVGLPPTVSMNPHSLLWDVAHELVKSHARRLPLIDNDSAIGHELIVSVLTQYRLLKFLAINCKGTRSLHLPLRKLRIGTYVKAPPAEPISPTRFAPIQVATMETPVFELVQMFSQKSISAIPIVDDDGVVVNLYETVDVISLVKSGTYNNLDMTVSTALNMRSPDFPGVIVCTSTDSLASLFTLIRTRRVHRLIVVEGELEVKEGGKRGRLLGIITLADVLQYLVQDAELPPPTPSLLGGHSLSSLHVDFTGTDTSTKGLDTPSSLSVESLNK